METSATCMSTILTSLDSRARSDPFGSSEGTDTTHLALGSRSHGNQATKGDTLFGGPRRSKHPSSSTAQSRPARRKKISTWAPDLGRRPNVDLSTALPQVSVSVTDDSVRSSASGWKQTLGLFLHRHKFSVPTYSTHVGPASGGNVVDIWNCKGC